MEQQEQAAARQPVLSIVFYVLAACSIAVGVYIAIVCLNVPGAIQRISGMVQMPLLDLLLRPLRDGMIVVGVVALLSAVVVSMLLIACGRLLARATTLGRRVERLEAAIVKAGLMPVSAALDEAREQILDGAINRAA